MAPMSTIEADAHVAPEGPRYWPRWNDDVLAHPADAVRDLARYVATDALDDVTFREPPPSADAPPSTAAQERLMAERLYEVLSAENVTFWREPWVPGAGGQRIRDPWLVVRQRMATCLDFATTYASLLLSAVIAPHVAITRRHVDGDVYLHAFVLVQPGRSALDPAPASIPGCRRQNTVGGVSAVELWDELDVALEDGRLLAVDFARRLDEPRPFAAALEQGRTHLRDVRRDEGELWLADVAWLQRHGDVAPLPRLAERAPIRRYVPGGRGAFVRFRSHAPIVAELERRDDVVVLLGRPGTGKSTIGRQLAYGALFGAGWFLNASEPQTLIHSLSEAQAGESLEGEAPREMADRQGTAAAAIARLRETSDEWVVVLDNADGDPGRIVPHLPRPNIARAEGVRQLVLITTINEDWRHQGFPVLELPPVSDEESAQLSDVGPHIAPLARGRPLLFDAFTRLAGATGWDGERIAGYADPYASDPGPVALWAAAQDAATFGADERELALHAAWLPPDAQAIDALAALLSGADVRRAAGRLDALGLVGLDTERDELRMHRLVGQAIRDDLARHAPDTVDEILLRIASTPEAVRLLQSADLETMLRLDEGLGRLDAATAEPSPDLGVAIHEAASLLELHGHTRRSGERYVAADRHLADDDVVRRALGLHGRARMVNQHHPRDEPRLREAVDQVRTAQQMLEAAGHPHEADRCRALEGLLMQKLATFPGPGQSTVALLGEALQILEEADRRRRARDAEAAEVLRSRFNLAGIRIRLARSVPDEAAKHLAEADVVYGEVGDERRKLYGVDHHPHVAACVIGQAYVAYFRALLLDVPRPQRMAWLRAASRHTDAALEIREAQDGQMDGDECAKVLRFRRKVDLAREVIARSETDDAAAIRRAVEKATDDALSEIFQGFEGLLG